MLGMDLTPLPFVEGLLCMKAEGYWHCLLAFANHGNPINQSVPHTVENEQIHWRKKIEITICLNLKFVGGCLDVFQYSRVVSCLSASLQGRGWKERVRLPLLGNPPPPYLRGSSRQIWTFHSDHHPSLNLPQNSVRSKDLYSTGEVDCLLTKSTPCHLFSTECSSVPPADARAVEIDPITLRHIRPPGGQNKVH